MKSVRENLKTRPHEAIVSAADESYLWTVFMHFSPHRNFGTVCAYKKWSRLRSCAFTKVGQRLTEVNKIALHLHPNGMQLFQILSDAHQIFITPCLQLNGVLMHWWGKGTWIPPFFLSGPSCKRTATYWMHFSIRSWAKTRMQVGTCCVIVLRNDDTWGASTGWAVMVDIVTVLLR